MHECTTFTKETERQCQPFWFVCTTHAQPPHCLSSPRLWSTPRHAEPHRASVPTPIHTPLPSPTCYPEGPPTHTHSPLQGQAPLLPSSPPMSLPHLQAGSCTGPPMPLIMLTITASEVGRTYAEAAQHAGATIPAAAEPWGYTCGREAWVFKSACFLSLCLRLPLRGPHEIAWRGNKILLPAKCVCSGRPYLLI